MWVRGFSQPERSAVIGATVAGLIGATVGTVIGLRSNAPTAPFAAVELGLPSFIVGGIVGLGAGTVVMAARRIKRSNARRRSSGSGPDPNPDTAPHSDPG